MVSVETHICDFGRQAEDFSLKDPSGTLYTLADIRGESATLVMFICNHCPYVRAIVDRIVRDAEALQKKGVGVIAIMPNDYVRYPDDAPEKMTAFARQNGFTFPYVKDESQKVARSYDAVCTPDFFGFNADLKLQYRGRLDPSRREPVADATRDLFDAMCQIIETGQGPSIQHASMGCSIKWREAT
jgi:peroxiredoxin